MSNLCSRIVLKPQKRLQEGRDNMSVAQTNTWMNGESIMSVTRIDLALAILFATYSKVDKQVNVDGERINYDIMSRSRGSVFY